VLDAENIPAGPPTSPSIIPKGYTDPDGVREGVGESVGDDEGDGELLNGPERDD